jgi:hypothetical protein
MTHHHKWDGKTVLALVNANTPHPGKPVGLALSDRTARDLALALARLKQTTFALQGGVQELLDALNYVLVADPASVLAHQRMEAGKGMDPAASDLGSEIGPERRSPNDAYGRREY